MKVPLLALKRNLNLVIKFNHKTGTRLRHPIQDTLPKTDKRLSGSRTHVMEAIVYFQPSLLDLVTQLMHAHNQEELLQLGAVKGPRETMVL